MKIVILAGGKSERISPFKEKPLLRFCGKTLIRHQLEILTEAGGNDFLIIGSEANIDGIKGEGQVFLNETEAVANQDILIDYAVQTIDQGSAGALKSARAQLGGSDILIVSSNDILELSAYLKILATVENNPGSSVILGQKVEKYFPGGYLMIDGDNNLQKIIEKPGEGNEPSDLINIVAHFHPFVEDLMINIDQASSSHDDIYETALQMMIDQGKSVKVAEYEGKWQAVKYPWHIYDANKVLFEKEIRLRGKRELIAPDLNKADSAVIKGDVIIESGVKIMENAVISGPVYLGKGCIVANNALVRDSFVGDESVIGFGTEVARSNLGEKVWTHSNYLGDSIIANNVSFGAGTVTGNLRLDEGEIKVNIKNQKVNSGRKKLGVIMGDNVRVGINCSLMPGIKIGSNSIVGAGVVLTEDIGEQKYVTLAKSQLVIKENLAKINSDRAEFTKNIVK